MWSEKKRSLLAFWSLQKWYCNAGLLGLLYPEITYYHEVTSLQIQDTSIFQNAVRDMKHASSETHLLKDITKKLNKL